MRNALSGRFVLPSRKNPMPPSEPPRVDPITSAAFKATEYEIERNQLARELGHLPELRDLSPEEQQEVEQKHVRLRELDHLLIEAHADITRSLDETFERIRRDGREQLALERRSQFRLVSPQN